MTGSPAVLACGEVTSGIRQATTRIKGTKKVRKCSCGRRANKCPVWVFFCFSYLPRHTLRPVHSYLYALVQQVGGDYSAVRDSFKNSLGVTWHAVSSQAQIRLRVYVATPCEGPKGRVLVCPQAKEPQGQPRRAQAAPLRAPLCLDSFGMVARQFELRSFRRYVSSSLCTPSLRRPRRFSG